MSKTPVPELTQEEIDELTKEVKEKTAKDPIKSFLLMTQKGPPGSILDVKPLWKDFYRLNFWKETPSNCLMVTRSIIESRFVRVDNDGKKLSVKDLTRKEAE